MINMNQTDDSNNITIEKNINLMNKTNIPVSRTGELIIGITVSKTNKNIF